VCRFFLSNLIASTLVNQNCLVPRKYEADQKLATWVETQRVLWNRDYRDMSLPEPASVPPAASLDGKTPDDEWAEEMSKHSTGGATAEDAEELAAAMGDDAMMDDAQSAAVAAAVEAAAAEAVDRHLEDALKMDGVDGQLDDSLKLTNLGPKRLSLERKEKLDVLGFVWSLRNKRIEDHWDEMFRQV
jgi:hypothetical protein